MKASFKAVIFDWAGTTVDYGSRAPARVFVELFNRVGIDVTEAEARGPMGRAKWDHIAEILALPRVAKRWHELHGRPTTRDDINQLYADFLPRQKEVLAAYSGVIPGVPEAVAECRRRGMKIGATTGYTRELMDIVEAGAREGGYVPDVSLGADDAPAGRPAPWMIFRVCERLDVYPMSAVLVVDDTPVGIAAGRNAGAVTVAITRTGNALGLARAEVEALAADELEAKLRTIENEFRAQGADHVIPSVADLPRLLDKLGTT